MKAPSLSTLTKGLLCTGAALLYPKTAAKEENFELPWWRSPYVWESPYTQGTEVLEDFESRWTLRTAKGKVLKRKGEIRVQISSVMEDAQGDSFFIDAHELKDHVQEAIEEWNTALQKVDPTVQFVMESELRGIPCTERVVNQLARDELLICVPPRATWENWDNLRREWQRGKFGYAYGFLGAFVEIPLDLQDQEYFAGSTIKLRNQPFQEDIHEDALDYYKQGVLKHELGHILGLGHAMERNFENIMGSTLLPNATPEKIDSGTLQGLREIYDSNPNPWNF